ncbi:MAG: sigma-70 family RNA polymerase sigma factor [Acidobacteria bacterium]|nr:sigma-70 family RNA polymerase sigma factor [Acidobacteriota bacterium]
MRSQLLSRCDFIYLPNAATFGASKPMSAANGQPTEPVPVEKLFEQAVSHLPGIIRRAFRRCHHHASSDDVERCWLRLMMLLWDEGEYKPLRTFREEAQLPTYLFPIAYHEVIRFLVEAGRNVPLENLPPAMIEQAPQQYESVLWGERLRKLDEAVTKSLTEHDQKLLALMREGKKTAEIAQELGIVNGTASVEKSLLLKKLQGLMED